MRFVDEYRDAELLNRQFSQIRRRATKPWVIMDVCGGQTHNLLRHGLESALEGTVELVHGPGCPVCVTPAEAIDEAIEIASRPEVLFTSFGDMLRVPGLCGSLLEARARGAEVRTVYSPTDAVQLAAQNPHRQVVFFAVGFETTTPATALAVLQADRLKLENFSLLINHVRVEPAMRSLISQPGCRVQGFLAAGHVCCVTGMAQYEKFLRDFNVPVVVTGFEPVDLLAGITECVDQLESGRKELSNLYDRSVRFEGNVHAQRLVDSVFQVATVPWRGFGEIVEGGFRLRPQWHQFDARRRWSQTDIRPTIEEECRSAAIMSGLMKPPECPLFGKVCTPETPVGAPMVSSEGACAAYFHYGRIAEAAHE